MPPTASSSAPPIGECSKGDPPLPLRGRQLRGQLEIVRHVASADVDRCSWLAHQVLAGNIEPQALSAGRELHRGPGPPLSQDLRQELPGNHALSLIGDLGAQPVGGAPFDIPAQDVRNAVACAEQPSGRGHAQHEVAVGGHQMEQGGSPMRVSGTASGPGHSPVIGT